jgi:hypothetical protein
MGMGWVLGKADIASDGPFLYDVLTAPLYVLCCLVCRYWSKLACDKRLCFAALNNVLQDTVEVTPEIDSSLSSAML